MVIYAKCQVINNQLNRGDVFMWQMGLGEFLSNFIVLLSIVCLLFIVVPSFIIHEIKSNPKDSNKK